MPAPLWMTPWRLRKARQSPEVLTLPDPDPKPARDPKSWSFDPQHLAWVYAGDVPSEAHPGTLGLDYGTFMTVARIPIIGAILQTRIQQVGEFSQPQPTPYSVGFRIRLRDLKKEPTRAQQKRAEEIQAIILRAGGKFQVGGFDAFLRMITRDALTYDQANFEILPTEGSARGAKYEPWGFIPVDAMTIRKARPSPKAIETGRWNPDETAFVQVIDHKVRNEYAQDELAWGIRRPRTWTYANGYGYPEIEELLSVITDLMNAQTFNAANFRTGIHSSALLTLFSAMDDTHFRALQRQLIAGLHGPRNSKRLAMIQLNPGIDGQPKDDLRSIPLSKSNKDMEYGTWINWLLKIACACYQMDPAELGFVFGNEGQTSSLGQAGPAERVWASKERGLRPLLRCIQQWLNIWVINKLDPEYMLEFVGFDSLSESEKVDLDIKAIRAYKTIDEVRAEHDLEPRGDELGDLILDPTFYQAWSQMRMEEQQGEQGGEFQGGPGGADMFQTGEGEEEPEGGGEMFQTGGGPEEAGIPAKAAAERLTDGIAADYDQARREGRLIYKGRQGKKGKWVGVPTTRGGRDRVRAYVVEVD